MQRCKQYPRFVSMASRGFVRLVSDAHSSRFLAPPSRPIAPGAGFTTVVICAAYAIHGELLRELVHRLPIRYGVTIRLCSRRGPRMFDTCKKRSKTCLHLMIMLIKKNHIF